MIVTLTGENGFGLGHELAKLIETFVAEHGELALERLEGEEADFARLQEALASLPFLASRKMVVLRSPSKNKQFAEAFEQILSDIPETNSVILVEPKLDKRLSYYKTLKSKTDFREFPELDQSGLSHWLANEAKSKNGIISPADARYLVERVGANQQMLSNELEKLLLYNSEITRESINLLTEPSPQSTIFQLLEAAFASNQKKTLDLYAEQRVLKVEPPQIVAMLTWQLHVLAIIKTAGDRPADQIAKETKINSYVIRKSQNIARNLSLADIKKLITELLDIDIKSKTTGIDLDEALQTYLISVTG
ncbi:MAG TPA: DNA polymerase III subunit delta [Candidatus Saccharimonadales bacterium]|jgi:DNA polymerase III delta subunit|nr:DNA polymerase III subunit delta [Candidatus Saccharimonadales bacterium]